MVVHTERPSRAISLQAAGLVVFGVLAALAALVGALGVSGTGQEYAALDKPGWAPPSWLFGPVWSVLYAMIAVSGWLVWRRHGTPPALAVYAVQLVLNAAWTPIFFGAGQYGWAMLDIALLWLAIGATVLVFRPLSRPATWLLLPYWLWVTYAAALNFAIWTANT
ncbi:tryptophan-rich sensory protein [Actinomadura craniellae]|uniref:Tryptophan-rich sensory protein n=1 Tax=Actinomadura craniellae TaxID=2231787 RepID=A0A365H3E6_9ACTN|nr:TspO/MBR family protein [Actinomadura craniellae]RAY13627.1 tryptophan-rich sensory protein [Actinomadura craniellae]